MTAIQCENSSFEYGMHMQVVVFHVSSWSVKR